MGTVWLWITISAASPDFVVFGLLYTLGNICMLGSGVFLTGLKNQWRLIRSYGRWACLLIYVGIMGFTIWYIFADYTEYDDDGKPAVDEYDELLTGSPNIFVVISLVIAQFLAGLWYMLSYVPYGRALAKKCMGKAVDSRVIRCPL